MDSLYWVHIGYATTIIAFYLLPVLLLREKNFLSFIRNFFLERKNYYWISLFFIYLFYLLIFFDFKNFTEDKYWVGLGFVHKISIILFDSMFLKKMFTYFAFFVSWIIILIFFNKNYRDKLILLYFFVISLFLWPLMQEYFDPFILLMIFTFFSSKLFLNYQKSIILYFYLSILLISANIYYS